MSGHKTKVIKKTFVKKEIVERNSSYTTYDVARISISGPFTDPSCTTKSESPTPKPVRPRTKESNWRSEVDQNASPFAMPKSEKDHEKVNALIKQLKHQMKEFEVFNEYGFHEIVLHRCLKALGIENSIFFGYRDICGPTSVPHIWLHVGTRFIDVTYRGCRSSYLYIQDNYPDCYTPVSSYDKTQTPHQKGQGCQFLEKKRIEFFATKPDHALALCLNQEQSYNFYFAMIRYMFDEHKVSIQGIAPEIRYQCWNCLKFPKGGRNYLSNIMDEDSDREDSEEIETIVSSVRQAGGGGSWKFLQCPRCMVASYCSRKCQEEDWISGHKWNCLDKNCSLSPDPLR